MTYARIVDVKFKPGMRDEGMSIIADIGKEVRDGFEGMLILLPTDEPDKVTFVSLWDSENAMSDSWERINPKAERALKDLMDGKPSMRTNQVREVQKISLAV